MFVEAGVPAAAAVAAAVTAADAAGAAGGRGRLPARAVAAARG